MLRAAFQFGLIVVLVLAGTVALHWYSTHDAAQQKLAEAQAQTKKLEEVVQRLTDEKRIAEMIVTDDSTVEGVAHKTLLFVEYARDGSSLPPRSFNIAGDMVHVEAMVIKFDRHFVSENDSLRGRSIALFTRIYGDHQTPEQAEMIDAPGKIPEIYRGADPRVEPFEQSLWNDFWRLYSDENFRAEHGVRTSSGQGVWGPFEREKLYTITLEADGGLSLTATPLKAIYREALRSRQKS